jgi:hypothetical protein
MAAAVAEEVQQEVQILTPRSLLLWLVRLQLAVVTVLEEKPF